jgi:hypothetical protein
MQVNFQHDAKVVGLLFGKTHHLLTTYVEFTEEEVYLLEQLGLLDTPLFNGQKLNLFGKKVAHVYTPRDMHEGPMEMEFDALHYANQAEADVVESLRQLKDALYNLNHDANRQDSIEI